MKTTAELIERISPRYQKVRNEKLEVLWEDFLQGVEKVIAKLPDEILAAVSSVTIAYFVQEGDPNVYRSKTAEISFSDNYVVEYEENDVCLGKKEMLEVAFVDFKAKAKKDSNIGADWFDVEDLGFDEDIDGRILLDFKLPRKL